MEQDIFVIGGGEIYKTLLPYCDRIYLTKILDKCKDVDTYFPNLDKEYEWVLTKEGQLHYGYHKLGIEKENGKPVLTPVSYQFQTYDRFS